MFHLVVLGAHSLVRASLVSLLQSMDFEVEQAPNLSELDRQTPGDARPEIVLVTLQEDEDVSGFMQGLRAWAPMTKVVFLAHDLDVKALSRCFAAGASGVLLENLTREALRCSLALVGAGEKVFPSELAAFVADLGAQPDGAELAAGFSARERQILGLLAEGRSNKVIAAALKIAEPTVKLHLRTILRKLGVSNRTQAALWAVRMGLSGALTDSQVAIGSGTLSASANGEWAVSGFPLETMVSR